MWSSFVGLIFGLVLGARHALEPDHLTAVTVLATESRSPRRTALLGALWGLGHTAALLGAGTVLVCFSAAMPPRLGDAFELLVAFMLVGLGLAALRKAIRSGPAGSAEPHVHGTERHVHPGTRDHVHLGSRVLAARPLFIGLVHGLAGSGALVALVVARLPSIGERLSFIGLFGLGSMLGMTVLSGLLGLPLAALSRQRTTSRLLRGLSGVASIALGVALGAPIWLRLAASAGG